MNWDDHLGHLTAHFKLHRSEEQLFIIENEVCRYCFSETDPLKFNLNYVNFLRIIKDEYLINNVTKKTEEYF